MHHQTSQKSLLASLALAAVLAATPAGVSRLEPLDEDAFTRVVKSGKGQVVLVNFWATWCAPCRDEMPALAKLDTRLRARGFRLVTVSADEPEQEAQALKFLVQQGVVGPAYIKRARNDENFINSIDRKWSGALPASFLFDRTGNKVHSFIGDVPVAELEAAIGKLL